MFSTKRGKTKKKRPKVKILLCLTNPTTFQRLRLKAMPSSFYQIHLLGGWWFNYAAITNRVPDSEVPEGVDFDTWLGPAPDRNFNSQRFHGSWRMFWDYGGGLMTDWGVHLLDMALWAKRVKSMPLSVQANGGNFLFPDGVHETFDTQSVLYQFDDYIMTWENNAGMEFGPYGKN